MTFYVACFFHLQCCHGYAKTVKLHRRKMQEINVLVYCTPSANPTCRCDTDQFKWDAKTTYAECCQSVLCWILLVYKKSLLLALPCCVGHWQNVEKRHRFRTLENFKCLLSYYHWHCCIVWTFQMCCWWCVTCFPCLCIALCSTFVAKVAAAANNNNVIIILIECSGHRVPIPAIGINNKQIIVECFYALLWIGTYDDLERWHCTWSVFISVAGLQAAMAAFDGWI